MKRFKNIIYVIDDADTLSEQYDAQVVTLARLNSAKVTVVKVMEESFLDQLNTNIFGSDDDLVQSAMEHELQEIENHTRSRHWEGIEVASEVLRGKAFIAIIQKVLKDGHDLVIKHNTVDDGVDPLAMRLMRKCPCPIWILRAGDTGSTRKIMAALDVMTTSEETERLNTMLIELAHSLAQREQGEAHYLHAWRLQSETMLRGPRFKLSDDKIAKMKGELKEGGEKKLRAMLEKAHITPLPGHIHIEEGNASEVILAILQNQRIDILVLGTVGRTGVPGLLIGNTAEKLLAKVTCSVLAVKPADFVSPVTLS